MSERPAGRGLTSKLAALLNPEKQFSASARMVGCLDFKTPMDARKVLRAELEKEYGVMALPYKAPSLAPEGAQASQARFQKDLLMEAILSIQGARANGNRPAVLARASLRTSLPQQDVMQLVNTRAAACSWVQMSHRYKATMVGIRGSAFAANAPKDRQRIHALVLFFVSCSGQ